MRAGVVSEGASFIWLGPDLRLAPGQGPDSVAYGVLPPARFPRVQARRSGMARRAGHSGRSQANVSVRLTASWLWLKPTRCTTASCSPLWRASLSRVGASGERDSRHKAENDAEGWCRR